MCELWKTVAAKVINSHAEIARERTKGAIADSSATPWELKETVAAKVINFPAEKAFEEPKRAIPDSIAIQSELWTFWLPRSAAAMLR